MSVSRPYRWQLLNVLAFAALLGTLSAFAEDKPRPEWSVETQAASMLKSLGPPPIQLELPVDPQEDRSIGHQAGRLLKLVDSAAQGDTWQAEPGCRPDPQVRRTELCGLSWRKNDALSEFRARYQATSHKLKSRFVGKTMADHLELDLDSSPEIRLKWDFD